MPIAYWQLEPTNAGQPGYAIAKELAMQTAAFYGAVAGMGFGIGGGSCRAALAMVPGNGLPAARVIAAIDPPPAAGTLPLPTYGNALPYGIVYGNSQLAVGGLVPGGAIGGHAERAALTAANGLQLYTIPQSNHAVLFVELTPCVNCRAWLDGNGGGIVNPFNGVINGNGGTTLNVWWRWEYPGPGLPANMGGALALGGTDEMNLWHTWQWVWPGQLLDIDRNW